MNTSDMIVVQTFWVWSLEDDFFQRRLSSQRPWMPHERKQKQAEHKGNLHVIVPFGYLCVVAKWARFLTCTPIASMGMVYLPTYHKNQPSM